MFKKHLLAKASLVWIACLAAVVFIPRLDPAGSGQPGVITLLGVGLAIIVLTSTVLYYGINSQSNLGKQFILYLLIYNALIILVKFTISPLSVYTINQTQAFSFEINNNPMMLAIIAGGVFLLYFLVFGVIYWHYKSKVVAAIAVKPEPKPEPKVDHWSKRIVLIAVIFGLVILIAFSGLYVVPLIFSLTAVEYLSYVFSGGLGALVALALLGAIFCVTRLFRTAADQAILLRDLSVLATFFWIGVAFIFIYHVLWVVYLLVLTSLWPLRVVVPK